MVVKQDLVPLSASPAAQARCSVVVSSEKSFEATSYSMISSSLVKWRRLLVSSYDNPYLHRIVLVVVAFGVVVAVEGVAT